MREKKKGGWQQQRGGEERPRDLRDKRF